MKCGTGKPQRRPVRAITHACDAWFSESDSLEDGTEDAAAGETRGVDDGADRSPALGGSHGRVAMGHPLLHNDHSRRFFVTSTALR